MLKAVTETCPDMASSSRRKPWRGAETRGVHEGEVGSQNRHAGEFLETEARRWEVHEQVGLNLRAQARV